MHNAPDCDGGSQRAPMAERMPLNQTERGQTVLEEHAQSLDNVIDRLITAEDRVGEILNRLRGTQPAPQGPESKTKQPTNSTLDSIQTKANRLHEITDYLNQMTDELGTLV